MKHAFLVAVAALLAPAVTCAADLSGAWKFEATGPRGGASTMTCTLTRSGTNITGSCVTQQGTTVDVTGTVSGADVDFGYNLAGSPLRVDFKGVIQPDGSIKGTVSAAIPPAPFTGTKQ
jgi:opacity protein-like surface antigen